MDVGKSQGGRNKLHKFFRGAWGEIFQKNAKKRNKNKIFLAHIENFL